MNKQTEQWQQRCAAFFGKPIFSDWRLLLGLWLLIAVIASLQKYGGGENNFLIFRGVFWHVFNEQPLYAPYPGEYFDVNHYGPVFSLVIAPFAVVPRLVGLLLWNVALVLFLYVAVRRGGYSRRLQLFVLWFCLHELLNGVQMQQFNIAIAAIILLSFSAIERENDFMAAFFIVLGTLVKLYGVVGLAFFFFSKHKGRFVGSLAFWGVVLFVAPMVISNWDYIVGQYQAWYTCLGEKNADNMFSIGTNISLLGMIRKLTGCAGYSDLLIIVPGLVLFALPYLRVRQYANEGFRLTLLASVLMFTVLFSTGSENSTYIIAVVGVAVWYAAAPWKRSGWDVALMVYVFVFCTMAHSDLVPRELRESLIKPYALKALPCIIVWLKLCYEMCVKDYAPSVPSAQAGR